MCVYYCAHTIPVYPPFKGVAGVLAWCEQETMLVSDRGRERRARERRRELAEASE